MSGCESRCSLVEVRGLSRYCVYVLNIFPALRYSIFVILGLNELRHVFGLGMGRGKCFGKVEMYEICSQ